MPRADVAEVRTVHDELVDFFARRQRLAGNERGQWFLVDQAKARGLPGIAELQATAIALQGGEFAAEAHRFLGHRETARGWLWPHDNQHLTFSQGIHYCLGAALARLEGQVVFADLARRWPELQLAAPPEEIEYRDHFVLRGLKALPVVVP